jgi:hypothetical protein
MIPVTAGTLKFILRGRAVRVEVPREYRKGKVYSAGTGPKRRCRVVVVDVARLEGGWELLVRHCSQPPVWYLAASPGAQRADYTSNPLRAAREANGSPIEAVEVGERWLERRAAEASERDDARRRESAAERAKRPAGRYSVVSSLPTRGRGA